MSKNHSFIVKHKGKETEMFRVKLSNESGYIIPCHKENKNGIHLSIHPSGILSYKDNKGTQKTFNILKFKEVFYNAIKKSKKKNSI